MRRVRVGGFRAHADPLEVGQLSYDASIDEIECFVDNLDIARVAEYGSDVRYEDRKDLGVRRKRVEKKQCSRVVRLVPWVGGVVVVLLVLFLVVIPSLQGSLHFLIVLSGSMQPEIEPGDIVVSCRVDPADVVVGDVITFDSGERSDNLVTHRVVNVSVEGGGVVFETKGDANAVADRRLVGGDEVVGRVGLVVPYVGYVPYFAQSQWGFVLLIVVPCVLIIGLEVRDVVRSVGGKRERKDS